MKQSQSLKYRADVLEYDSVSRYLFKLVEIDKEEGMCPEHAPWEKADLSGSL